ncbi:MAG: hypothetical protein K8M05_37585 [Deltaproteobacteria bacterium]|nr:hypothetical protein [Kofleriaceae bacterium]
MRILLAFAFSVGLLACSGPAKKGPEAPPAEDVPQEVTCCISPGVTETDPQEREVVPADKCPEEQRHPVDACNVGPGENEPSM